MSNNKIYQYIHGITLGKDISQNGLIEIIDFIKF